MLNSRVYQTNLTAISKSALTLSAEGEINTKLQQRQDQQKAQFDKSSKTLTHLYPQEPVRVFNPVSHICEPGIVKGTTQSPRSYVVAMGNGGILTRNRRHIRSTKEDIKQQDTENIDTGSSTPEPPPTTTPPKVTEESMSPNIPLRRSTRKGKPPDKLNL